MWHVTGKGVAGLEAAGEALGPHLLSPFPPESGGLSPPGTQPQSPLVQASLFTPVCLPHPSVCPMGQAPKHGGGT